MILLYFSYHFSKEVYEIEVVYYSLSKGKIKLDLIFEFFNVFIEKEKRMFIIFYFICTN